MNVLNLVAYATCAVSSNEITHPCERAIDSARSTAWVAQDSEYDVAPRDGTPWMDDYLNIHRVIMINKFWLWGTGNQWTFLIYAYISYVHKEMYHWAANVYIVDYCTYVFPAQWCLYINMIYTCIYPHCPLVPCAFQVYGYSKNILVLFMQMHLKCRLQKDDHFVKASICWRCFRIVII